MTGLVTRTLFPSGPRSILRDIDALFDEAFGARTPATAEWAPRIESFVKDDTLHVRADLPGVEPKGVDVSVEDDVLTIRGERKTEHEDATYREIGYGRFERRIRVPDGTDVEKISAKYVNGVLEVAVPLPKPVSRKVAIDVATA